VIIEVSIHIVFQKKTIHKVTEKRSLNRVIQKDYKESHLEGAIHRVIQKDRYTW